MRRFVRYPSGDTTQFSGWALGFSGHSVWFQIPN